MPRKVLITKDILEEILAKYQGGGSGGQGGSGKLYEYSFELTRYDANGNIVNWTTPIADTQALKFYLTIYESNFERVKNAWNEFASYFEGQMPSINNKNDIITIINALFGSTTAEISGGSPDLSLVFFSFLAQLCDGLKSYYVASGEMMPIVYSVFPSAYSLTFLTVAGAVRYSNDYTDEEIYNYGLNTNNSCTLTEYGTSSQGGGTVEAEPIVSIKMTNVDGRDIQEEQPNIVNLQFYCTKERWDNFVSLASSQFQTDITYANFDSVFKSLNRQTQDFALGFLMMDYYDGKVLPNMYAYQVQSQSNLDAKIGIPSTSFLTIKGQETNNIEIVAYCYFAGNFGCAIPNQDVSDVYTTADTVITVEEIEGSAIGSSSGSGTQEVSFDAETGIYRFALTVYTDREIDLNIYLDGDCMLEAVRTIATLQHISPLPTEVDLDELNDMLENATHAERINFFNIGCYFAFSHGYSIADGQNFQGQVSTMYFDNSKFYIKENDDTSVEIFDISDVVDTSYLLKSLTSGTIQVSGGSGSSADTLKNYKETLTFYDQNGDKICGINKILSLKTKEWYYGVLNNGIQSAASMLGLTIPTITDDNTAQSGVNTILGAMQQAGVSANIPLLILNFVTDFDFVIKQSVSNAGTEVYPLFVTGDISAYILYGDGTMISLLQMYDFTGAYTVGYSLMEVNVTD